MRLDRSTVLARAALLALLLPALLAAKAPVEGPKAQLVVKLALASDSVSLHEPVPFTLQFSNSTRGPVALELGKDFQIGFEVRVTAGGGATQKLRLSPSDGLGDAGHLAIRPLATVGKRFLLDDWFAAEAPGEYRVAVEVLAQARAADGSPLELVQAEPVTLSVGPADAGRLREVCRDLAERSVKAATAEEGLWASRQLSLVRDSEAVPYLETLLTQSLYGRGNALVGLQRMGGALAADVLIRYLERPDPPLQANAVSILYMIGLASGDQALRERITKAIAPYLPRPDRRQ